MKILHVELQTKTGGVASLVYDICNSQIMEGHEVDVFTWRNDNNSFDPDHKLEKIGVRTLKSKFSSKYNLRKINELKNLMQNYDIVHIHLFPIQFFAAIAQSLIPEKKRPILVTTEHNTYNNRRKFPILRKFDRWFYSKYNSIVGISPQTTINLKEWLEDETLNNRVETITNGINLDKFSSAQKCETGFECKKGCKYLVMVARMMPPKDPLTILRALPLCNSNVHLVLIGEGPLLDEIRKLSEELNLADRVHLMGNVADVQNYLKNFDIGILSTNWDGFGLVAVEYMAAGLPVLASDVDGLRDVIGNKKYLFPTGDYKDLAKKIGNLLDSESQYSEAQKYFSERATDFSRDKMGKQYLDLYRCLLANKSNI